MIKCCVSNVYVSHYEGEKFRQCFGGRPARKVHFHVSATSKGCLSSEPRIVVRNCGEEDMAVLVFLVIFAVSSTNNLTYNVSSFLYSMLLMVAVIVSI